MRCRCVVFLQPTPHKHKPSPVQLRASINPFKAPPSSTVKHASLSNAPNPEQKKKRKINNILHTPLDSTYCTSPGCFLPHPTGKYPPPPSSVSFLAMYLPPTCQRQNLALNTPQSTNNLPGGVRTVLRRALVEEDRRPKNWGHGRTEALTTLAQPGCQVDIPPLPPQPAQGRGEAHESIASRGEGAFPSVCLSVCLSRDYIIGQ